ncbi:MAG: hypothetical protein VST71_09485 [Nitrospirota bacterium]|nr:hypothetical protein [Nitrospirota bacterium]
MMDLDNIVEIRVLGPQGKYYIDLEKEFSLQFEEQGAYFMISRLFSAPPETTVMITIGIGVITGVTTHVLAKLIDKIFDLKKRDGQENTNVTISLHIGDKYVNLPSDKEEMLKKINEYRKDQE